VNGLSLAEKRPVITAGESGKFSGLPDCNVENSPVALRGGTQLGKRNITSEVKHHATHGKNIICRTFIRQRHECERLENTTIFVNYYRAKIVSAVAEATVCFSNCIAKYILSNRVVYALEAFIFFPSGKVVASARFALISGNVDRGADCKKRSDCLHPRGKHAGELHGRSAQCLWPDDKKGAESGDRQHCGNRSSVEQADKAIHDQKGIQARATVEGRPR